MAVQFVQQTAAVQHTEGGATSLSLDLPVNITAGNFIVVTVVMWLDDRTTPSVSCSITGESTPTMLHKADGVGAPGGTYIFYLPNAVGGNKTITITSTQIAGNTFMDGRALEFSGIATSSPADGTVVVGAASSTTITAGPFTPTQSGDLFIAVLEETNGQALTNTSSGSGASWVEIMKNPGGQGGMSLYLIATTNAAQTASATFTTDGNDNWSYVIQAFKAAASGGGTDEELESSRVAAALSIMQTY